METLQTSGTVIVRPACPGGLVSPHPKKDAALGLILGIMLGLGVAFGMEALDTRVRSTSELAEGLGGLPLLARLPPPPSKIQKRDELAMVVQPKHNAAEAFRLLRSNLEFVRLSAGDVRTILVTSAVEKEGKSTTAANLAVAEARSGPAGRPGRPRPPPTLYRSFLPPHGVRGRYRRRTRQGRARVRRCSGSTCSPGAPDSSRCAACASLRLSCTPSPSLACSTSSSPARFLRTRASSQPPTVLPRSSRSCAKLYDTVIIDTPPAPLGRRRADALVAGRRLDRRSHG